MECCCSVLWIWRLAGTRRWLSRSQRRDGAPAGRRAAAPSRAEQPAPWFLRLRVGLRGAGCRCECVLEAGSWRTSVKVIFPGRLGKNDRTFLLCFGSQTRWWIKLSEHTCRRQQAQGYWFSPIPPMYLHNRMSMTDQERKRHFSETRNQFVSTKNNSIVLSVPLKRHVVLPLLGLLLIILY